MIVKKVATSQTAAPKSKAANVRALADYIAGPGAGGDGEKVEHRGALTRSERPATRSVRQAWRFGPGSASTNRTSFGSKVGTASSSFCAGSEVL